MNSISKFENKEWSFVGTLKHQRKYHVSIVYNGEIFIAGGESPDPRCWLFDDREAKRLVQFFVWCFVRFDMFKSMWKQNTKTSNRNMEFENPRTKRDSTWILREWIWWRYELWLLRQFLLSSNTFACWKWFLLTKLD